jgi:hypothetical protein
MSSYRAGSSANCSGRVAVKSWCREIMERLLL